jgi:hypothetical protein
MITTIPHGWKERKVDFVTRLATTKVNHTKIRSADVFLKMANYYKTTDSSQNRPAFQNFRAEVNV